MNDKTKEIMAKSKKQRKSNKKRKGKKKQSALDILIKASGKAVRELAIKNGEGFKRTTKVHKSKKTYSRKKKHKKDYE